MNQKLENEVENYFADVAYLRALKKVTFKSLCKSINVSEAYLRRQLHNNSKYYFRKCKIYLESL